MRTFRRWTIIPAVTLALSMAACGSDEGTTATPSTVPQTLPGESVDSTAISAPAGSDSVEITVTAGVDSAADRVEDVPLGSTVTLTVINPDKDDEFHVHGYDLGDGEEVPQGEPKIFTFTADRAGEFEVESHTTETVLLILEVS